MNGLIACIMICHDNNSLKDSKEDEKTGKADDDAWCESRTRVTFVFPAADVAALFIGTGTLV